MREFPVNIYVYTFCYNNAQILPYIIDYWSKYATKVIVYDNESTDNSKDILSKYNWIEIRLYNTNNKYNPEKIQNIKNQCYKEAIGEADYVMVCNIDEVLFFNNKLFQYLLDCKKANIDYFISKYYECISRNMPEYKPQELLQTKCKAVIDQKTKKILLFNPSINIAFSNYQYSYNISNNENLQSASIITLHCKMLGVAYMKERQNLYLSRMENNMNLQCALKYGANIDSITNYFNYFFCKIYIYGNVLKLSATNVLPKKLQTRQNTPENFITFKNCNFFDLSWTNTSIIYENDTKNRDCVVAIPVYKTNLTNNEIASLIQIYNILSSKYNIVLVGPENLDFNVYEKILNKNVNILKCNPEYFKTIRTYSYLCETYQFYQCFNDYNFMLLYQLDGWIFKDNVRKFILLDYDYIGAPWLNNPAAPDCHVGNGGVSFRKISKFIDICKNIDKKYLSNQYLTQFEDYFFCNTCKKILKDDFEIPNMSVASTFSLDGNDNYWIEKNNGKLPMCLHKWEFKQYWKNKIVPTNVQNQIFKIKNKEKITNGIQVALCAIAKNENLYIREWVEWYKNLGITKIFLYDNNDLDGEHFEEVINDYIQDGYVQIINKRGIEKGLVYDKNGVNLQPACYCECYETYGANFDWMCFFDIDEFLTFKNSNLEIFLTNKKFEKAETILIPWETYDSNNQIYYNNKPVQERFTHVSDIYKKYAVKSIVKCKKEIYKDRNINCLIHCFLTKNKSIYNISGKCIAFNKDNWYSYNTIKTCDVVLRHYKTKSAEEFIKRQLNRHWGTSKRFTNKSLDLNDCITNFYTVNKRSKEFDNFFNNIKKPRIIVNFTTWKKRDCYIKQLLENFSQQTVKPDKIICWLSKTEYNEKIPETIQSCLDLKLLTEVRWVDGNTYCHKRWEAFKEFNNDINFMIDDDILYDKNYIKTILTYIKKYPHNVITYYCNNVEYNLTNLVSNKKSYTEDYKNVLLSGTSCFPPNTFPLESFNYTELRDKICQKCDDSWISAWLIKNNIHIYGGETWNASKLKIINNTQNNGIWNMVNSKLVNGILYKVIIFASIIKSLNIESKVKQIWPNFNIEKAAKIKI